MRTRGFTLVELLVVIAVIAVLAALLFPVFASAREQARKSTCLSNERQIGTALNAYTQDYDEGYPNTGDPYLWVGRRFRWPIMPYLGVGQHQQSGTYDSSAGQASILLCPSDTQSGSDYNATSYAYSSCFYHTGAQINAMKIADLRTGVGDPGAGAQCVTQTQAAVAAPAQKAVLSEWFTNHDHPGTAPLGFWGANARNDSSAWAGSRAYVFADGHVKYLKVTGIRPAVDGCPDILLTVDGLAGTDLR